MNQNGYAFFVENPATIEELQTPHPIERERAYHTVAIIKLASIDYENFITDMLADRAFLEKNAALCSFGEIWNCRLIQQRGRSGGVLVMPKGGCYVGWAAYINK